MIPHPLVAATHSPHSKFTICKGRRGREAWS
jgi:hypothetical protein